MSRPDWHQIRTFIISAIREHYYNKPRRGRTAAEEAYARDVYEAAMAFFGEKP